MKLCLDCIGKILSFENTFDVFKKFYILSKAVKKYLEEYNSSTRHIIFKLPAIFPIDINKLNITKCISTIEFDQNMKSLKILKYFPNKYSVTITFNKNLTDKDFIYLKGIYKLWMIGCKQKMITDKAFSNLSGIHELVMNYCDQSTITDKAFSYLSGIYELSMAKCKQETITTKALSYIKGVKIIDIRGCSQLELTDESFSNFKGLHTLMMGNCDISRLTDKAFSYLVGIKKLEMQDCEGEILHNRNMCLKAFSYLKGIKELCANGCTELHIDIELLKCLGKMEILQISGCVTYLSKKEMKCYVSELLMF